MRFYETMDFMNLTKFKKNFMRFYDFMRSGRSENNPKMITIKHVVNTK